MASDEMLSWLRDVIEGDKGLAEVAASSERYGVRYTGHWTYTVGDDLVYQDGRRIPGVAGIVGRSCDCCGPASLGYPHDLMHIATHDPRDTIARCESELLILDHYERQRAAWPPLESGRWVRGRSRGALAGSLQTSVMESIVRLLARGYRHRPGFRPEWVED